MGLGEQTPHELHHTDASLPTSAVSDMKAAQRMVSQIFIGDTSDAHRPSRRRSGQRREHLDQASTQPNAGEARADAREAGPADGTGLSPHQHGIWEGVPPGGFEPPPLPPEGDFGAHDKAPVQAQARSYGVLRSRESFLEVTVRPELWAERGHVGTGPSAGFIESG
jgi:hypothetical protein